MNKLIFLPCPSTAAALATTTATILTRHVATTIATEVGRIMLYGDITMMLRICTKHGINGL